MLLGLGKGDGELGQPAVLATVMLTTRDRAVWGGLPAPPRGRHSRDSPSLACSVPAACFPSDAGQHVFQCLSACLVLHYLFGAHRHACADWHVLCSWRVWRRSGLRL